MSTFLITGGCGFIGSHLSDSLISLGHRVRILDNLSSGKLENISPDCKLVIGDVTDSETVKEAMENVDGCFHLAAIASVQRSNEAWVQTHQVNLTGSITIFEAARQRSVPVVYASSAAVYGNNTNLPLTEEEKLNPTTAYGADKMGSELHAKVAATVHGVPNIGFRFFNVYGDRQDPSSPYSGVISIFVDRLLHGKSLTIFGDGTQSRDFIHVSDVVRFLLAGMKKADTSHRVYNVCTGNATSINQLAQILSHYSEVPLGIIHRAARQGDIQSSLGSPEKATRELGITAKMTFMEGLGQMLEKKSSLNPFIVHSGQVNA